MNNLKSGSERFIIDDKEAGFYLLQFWSWAMSDLLDNVNRGVLAEYIVAKALNIKLKKQRASWEPYDLKTEDGIKIEVKSSAYIQSWNQQSNSTPSFRVPKTRFYNMNTNRYSENKSRHADVYVFAVLYNDDRETVNPIDLNQWMFYVISTIDLESHFRNRKTVSLSTLKRIGFQPVSFKELSKAVRAM